MSLQRWLCFQKPLWQLPQAKQQAAAFRMTELGNKLYTLTSLLQVSDSMCLYFLEQNICCRSLLFFAVMEGHSPNKYHYPPLRVGATSTHLHLLFSLSFPFSFTAPSPLFPWRERGCWQPTSMPCLLAALQQEGKPHVDHCVALFNEQKPK